MVLARGVAWSQSAPLFVDDSARSGLASMAYENGARGRLELLALMGPGVAFFDYDGDGDLDLFLPQGGTLPSDAGADTATAPASGGGRLLRNDLQIENGVAVARFVDVTARAGLRPGGYGVAAAVGDYDGDGAPDLFVGNIGDNRLWRNRGDGTFAEETPDPLRRPGWTSGASFFDADGDGDLDLYVVDYVEPVPGVHCFAESSRPDYCGPAAYKPLPDRLLRNDGGAGGGGNPSEAVRWTDLSATGGIAGAGGPGLGVVASDADGDGRLDLFVANDGQPNFLWHNLGGGRFVEDGLVSGTALSRDGLARAGMGVEAGDLDGDGDEELFVTNLTGEGNTLYLNDSAVLSAPQRAAAVAAPGASAPAGSGLLFEDRTAEAGLSAPSKPWTGFGTAFVDADLDGWLDLLVVNGAVRLADVAHATGGTAGGETRLGQPTQLYLNQGRGRFTLAPPALAGEVVSERLVARGLAVGDADNDGDADVVVGLNDAAPRLWLSQAPAAAAWLGVAPCPGVADAPWLARTATVTATSPGSALPSLRRRPHRDGSYASARDPRAVAGFGTATPGAVELRGGATTVRWNAPAPRSYLLWCPAGHAR
jgi:enediyne biosynthesis protein E4